MCSRMCQKLYGTFGGFALTCSTGNRTTASSRLMWPDSSVKMWWISGLGSVFRAARAMRCLSPAASAAAQPSDDRCEGLDRRVRDHIVGQPELLATRLQRLDDAVDRADRQRRHRQHVVGRDA